MLTAELNCWRTPPIASADDLIRLSQSSDADGDTVSLSPAWTKNGHATAHVTDTVPATDTASGDIWVCTVTPDDGDDLGASASATVGVSANGDGAAGLARCASAGISNDPSGFTSTHCLAEDGVSGNPSADPALNTWQPGSIFIFSPE